MKDVSTKRERDKSVLLDMVRRFGPLSRVDIHQMTLLRPGTVSTLVRELLRERTLIEAGLSDNPMGRKQVLLHLNEDHSAIAALAFDAESVVAAVFNLGARMKHMLSEPTDLEHGTDGVVNQMLRLTESAIAKAGVQRHVLVGIGVADSGVIDSRQGISVASSTLEFWHAVPLGQRFETHFRAPLRLESNTRARTVAERGASSSKAISPKKSPTPSSARCAS